MNKIILIKMLIFTVIICSSCTINNNIFESKRIEIADFLIDNKKIIIMNNLKAVEALNLVDKEENYIEKRLEYLISILKKEKSDSNELFIKKDDYYNSLPIENKNIFDWSERNFTSQLLFQIENEYGNIEIPIDIIKEINYGPIRK